MENSSYGIKQVKFKGLRGELTISVLSTYFIVHVSHMQYIYIYMMKACSIYVKKMNASFTIYLTEDQTKQW